MARVKKMAPSAGEIDDLNDAEFIIANPSEMEALKDVERLLAESSRAMTSGTSNSENTGLIILGPGGHQVPVPASLRVAALRFVRLVQSRPVQISSRKLLLSTTEAAEILSVSRPHVIKLIEAGELPAIRTGTKRKVALEDLILYKRARDARRRKALDRLVEMSAETNIDLADIEDFYQQLRGSGGQKTDRRNTPQGEPRTNGYDS